MQLENLAYALTQVIHNFGAVAVVGGAFVALTVGAKLQELRRPMAWLVLVGWAAQGISGFVFGGISVIFYGETPDLHATAMYALMVKGICASSGSILAFLFIRRGDNWTAQGAHRVWQALTGLAVVALTAAAFLRWFS